MIDQSMNEEETARAEEATAGETAENATSGADGGDDSGAGENVTSEEPAEAPVAEEGADPEEWRDKYLRLYAEFDNFRKRTMRERGDLVRSAGRDLIEAMLPVLDDFERAAAAGEGEDSEQAREGYRLIGQKMRGILEAKGLQRMEAKGAAFDTDLHEAITQIPSPSPEMKGKVVDVVEPGYKLHDSVLRFAKVVVGH